MELKVGLRVVMSASLSIFGFSQADMAVRDWEQRAEDLMKEWKVTNWVDLVNFPIMIRPVDHRRTQLSLRVRVILSVASCNK